MIVKINTQKNRKILDLSKGALLFELLIVISLLTIILSVGANAVFLSLRSNKTSGERDVASSLASEILEAVRAVTDENWQNIYSLTKSSQHYYTTLSAGKWILTAGDETVNSGGITYTRYVVIDNISRNGTTRNVEDSYTESNDDPSTQKITVTVSWPTGGPITISEYFFRWKNKICNQTDWSTGGSGTNVKTCPDNNYDTKDASVNVTGGQLKLQ